MSELGSVSPVQSTPRSPASASRSARSSDDRFADLLDSEAGSAGEPPAAAEKASKVRSDRKDQSESDSGAEGSAGAPIDPALTLLALAASPSPAVADTSTANQPTAGSTPGAILPSSAPSGGPQAVGALPPDGAAIAAGAGAAAAQPAQPRTGGATTGPLPGIGSEASIAAVNGQPDDAAQPTPAPIPAKVAGQVQRTGAALPTSSGSDPARNPAPGSPDGAAGLAATDTQAPGSVPGSPAGHQLASADEAPGPAAAGPQPPAGAPVPGAGVSPLIQAQLAAAKADGDDDQGAAAPATTDPQGTASALTQDPQASKLQAGMPAAPAAAVSVPHLREALLDGIKAGRKRFEIRLDPPELGRIDVHLRFGADGAVQARMVVDRQDTLDLLNRDARALERTLQNAGVRTDGGIDISMRDPSAGGYTPDREAFTHRPEGSRGEQRPTAASAADLPLPAAALYRARAIGRLDLTV